MSLGPKELFTIAFGLSVYISAVRIYGESRLADKNNTDNNKGVLIVLLSLITIPDIFMITTSLGALYSFYYGVTLNEFFEVTFVIGVSCLVILHIIEWIRNARRFGKLKDKCTTTKHYFWSV